MSSTKTGFETVMKHNVSKQNEIDSSSGLSKPGEDRDQVHTDLPMTVREAARFLGVSPQTVYLWVEKRQIPHLRVMGRNIRFLQSDLGPFRSQFKQEVKL
jgi:excisionase family DNA binding protein